MAVTCEACAAGMRLAQTGIHYKDGPEYKGLQTGATWGVCRKLTQPPTPQAGEPPRAEETPLGRALRRIAKGHRMSSVLAPILDEAADKLDAQAAEITTLRQQVKDLQEKSDTEQRAAFEAGWVARADRGYYGRAKLQKDMEEAYTRYQQSRRGEQP